MKYEGTVVNHSIKLADGILVIYAFVFTFNLSL